MATGAFGLLQNLLLLIPRDLLEPMIGTGDLDLDDVDRLQAIAKKFKVSLSALQYRLLAFT